MYLSLLPISGFLDRAAYAAEQTGFAALAIYAGRSADQGSATATIFEHWSSLHNLTGEGLLFCMSSGSQESELKVRGTSANAYMTRLSSPVEMMSDDFRRHFLGERPPPARQLGVMSSRPPPNPDQAVADSDLAATELCDYFGFRESDLPCLTLIDLESMTAFHIVRARLRIYDFIRSLVMTREDEWREHRNLLSSVRDTRIQAVHNDPLAAKLKNVETTFTNSIRNAETAVRRLERARPGTVDSIAAYLEYRNVDDLDHARAELSRVPEEYWTAKIKIGFVIDKIARGYPASDFPELTELIGRNSLRATAYQKLCSARRKIKFGESIRETLLAHGYTGPTGTVRSAPWVADSELWARVRPQPRPVPG